MTPARCPRSFEAEAMRDGRLAGVELASFARHMAGCSDCGREVRELESLSEAARIATERKTGPNELHVRRERTRLLAAFDGALLVREPRPAVRFLLWPAIAVTLVAGLFVFWRPQPDVQAKHMPTAVIRPDANTVWTERTEGDRRNVFLSHGSLWIQVDHSAGQGRVVVVLPDGELEDQGTIFTVSTEDGRTTRIAVQEGSVVLRLVGRAPVPIKAGETWRAPPRLPVLDSGGSQPSAPSPPRAVSARSRAVSSMSSPESQGINAPDLAADFRQAMALLDVGANRQAAAAFATFVKAHPGDPRAEDAAYLLILSLQRSDADEDMKRAAQQYLSRYPTGFRRAEAEKLSRAVRAPNAPQP